MGACLPRRRGSSGERETGTGARRVVLDASFLSDRVRAHLAAFKPDRRTRCVNAASAPDLPSTSRRANKTSVRSNAGAQTTVTPRPRSPAGDQPSSTFPDYGAGGSRRTAGGVRGVPPSRGSRPPTPRFVQRIVCLLLLLCAVSLCR
jgi:hypothetical protein